MDKEIFKLLYGGIAFEEAQEYFNKKIPITKSEFNDLTENYKKLAFTVSNYTDVKVLNTFYSEVLKAIKNGTTLKTFETSIDDFLTKNKLSKIDSLDADNIFRTNLQTAYSVGHYEQMTDEDVIKLRPYWKYDAVDDNNTRPEHKAMNGMVYKADDPIWDTWYPPNGYRCRCSVSSLSKRQVEERGLTVSTEEPIFEPDEGFCSNPAKAPFKPDISNYPESLQQAYKKINLETI